VITLTKVTLDHWELTFLWNLCNEDLGKLIADGRGKDAISERVVTLMNKLDIDYEEDE